MQFLSCVDFALSSRPNHTLPFQALACNLTPPLPAFKPPDTEAHWPSVTSPPLPLPWRNATLTQLSVLALPCRPGQRLGGPDHPALRQPRRHVHQPPDQPPAGLDTGPHWRLFSHLALPPPGAGETDFYLEQILSPYRCCDVCAGVMLSQVRGAAANNPHLLLLPPHVCLATPAAAATGLQPCLPAGMTCLL